ncbi:MAG: ABC transporter ATP-binding protein [Candidatus Heimdallarchaeota archaeon]|nr:ABC transporter ATP-binding protein [Candidatus Heimdallarchaeota archaeon]MCK4291174.1 ABC transporter ATP-binding protein [Candidatus Heimdallarchaeota archaeon]
MGPIIRVEKVSKIFGRYISRARVTSLRDIDFTINKGERICLFGPNGAGKSTLMKAIMGLTKPSQGQIYIKDYNVRWNPLRVKQSIGYLPSELNFYLNTPCKESLIHFGILRGLSRKAAKQETDRLLELIGLAKWWDLPPKLMSSGMRQRFSLSLAIIGDPEIILFDEPVAFIDVQGKLKVYQLVQDYVKDKAKTVIMSTHNIQDALVMSDRLILMDRGQIIVDGPITEVISKRCKSMEIILSQDAPSKKEIVKVIGEEDFELSGRKILVRSEDALQISTSIVNRLQESKISVFSFRPFVEQRRTKAETEESS